MYVFPADAYRYYYSFDNSLSIVVVAWLFHKSEYFLSFGCTAERNTSLASMFPKWLMWIGPNKQPGIKEIRIQYLFLYERKNVKKTALIHVLVTDCSREFLDKIK